MHQMRSIQLFVTHFTGHPYRKAIVRAGNHILFAIWLRSIEQSYELRTIFPTGRTHTDYWLLLDFYWISMFSHVIVLQVYPLKCLRCFAESKMFYSAVRTRFFCANKLTSTVTNKFSLQSQHAAFMRRILSEFELCLSYKKRYNNNNHRISFE